MSPSSRAYWGIVIILLHTQGVSVIMQLPAFFSSLIPALLGPILLLTAGITRKPRSWLYTAALWSGMVAGVCSLPYVLVHRDPIWIPSPVIMFGLSAQGFLSLCLFQEASNYEASAPVRRIAIAYFSTVVVLFLLEFWKCFSHGALSSGWAIIHQLCYLARMITGFFLVGSILNLQSRRV